MLKIIQACQQALNLRSKASKGDQDFSSDIRKRVAELAGMKVSAGVELASFREQLIEKAELLPEVDQKKLADRLVTWHSGHRNQAESDQRAKVQALANDEGDQAELNRRKSITAYDYFFREFPSEKKQSFSEMSEEEVDGLVISSAIIFNQKLAMINDREYMQAFKEGVAELPERNAVLERINRPKIESLKAKTAYQFLKEKIIEERRARGQGVDLIDGLWDVLVRTKIDALANLEKELKAGATEKFGDVTTNSGNKVESQKRPLSDSSNTSLLPKKQTIKGSSTISENSAEEFYKRTDMESTKNRQKNRSDCAQVEESRWFDCMSVRELENHLKMVSKIESVLMKIIENPGQIMEETLFSEGISRILNMDELLELYLCLREWKALVPSDDEIPYREKLEQLLEQESVELYSLRKIFPLTESGELKRKEDDGFVFVENETDRKTHYEGRRSNELLSLIKARV